MTTRVIGVTAFLAGILVGFIYGRLRTNEERLSLLDDLERENAMLWASVLILQSALRESQDRHHRTLEENGGGISMMVIGHD